MDAFNRTWQREDVRNKHAVAFMRDRKNKGLHPNSLEKKAIEILEQLGYKYKFVGDGKLIIGGRNPDFVHQWFKHRLIEVYSTYWHRDPVADALRIKELEDRGYRVLVIWDKDMNRGNEKQLAAKLRNYHASKRSV